MKIPYNVTREKTKPDVQKLRGIWEGKEEELKAHLNRDGASPHGDLKKFVFSKDTQKYWADAEINKLNIKRELDLYGFLPSSTVLN